MIVDMANAVVTVVVMLIVVADKIRPEVCLVMFRIVVLAGSVLIDSVWKVHEGRHATDSNIQR